MGLLFIGIELRSRFDRSFLYFGNSLIILCAIVGVDIWILPTITSGQESLYWVKVQHLFACGFLVFLNLNILQLTGSRYPGFIRLMIGASLAEAILILSGAMMHAEGAKVVVSLLYQIAFAPYILVFVASAHYFIFKNLGKAPKAERKILIFHLTGILVPGICGIIDMFGLIEPGKVVIHSATTYGVLAYGIMASLIFAERLMQVLKDREQTLQKLESAYKDLEQVNVLKQLGESTAIINHEIKNYMFMISGNAQLLLEVEHLSQKGSEIVGNIVTSVERLTGFSDDILKLSRTQIIKEHTPVNLSELVKGVVQRHYPDYAGRFTFLGCDRDHFLYGDWGKLEQVFVNLFNNCFEAGGGHPVDIRVKATSDRGLLLISVEDNGIGCNEGQLAKLFQAFYTTKKGTGGNGLGMSISRTIVESHGGRISAYSKNLGRKGEHGLKLILTFPVYAQNMLEEAGRKHPIVIIKDSMDNIADVIRVFQNVKVNPFIVQSISDLNEDAFPSESMTVLVTAKAMAANFTKLAAYPLLYMVSRHERNLYILDHGKGNRPEAFSEEYVVKRFLRRGAQRQRIREREVHTPAAA